jgi:hypothetical protein
MEEDTSKNPNKKKDLGHKIDKTSIGKDIAHVAIHGTAAPHDMLPGTEGDSDSQNVPSSSSSTFI